METMSVNDMDRFNLVVVGNYGIGKRSMLNAFFNNKFPVWIGCGSDFRYATRIKIENDDKIYELTAWDCGVGGEDYW